ncbi:LuxR C-terminal-related transcriptional regulator [uncultured Amnibacterium sp.]|uniref:LuxR C-terminal-related transcriptional regulator n=1 Tax=uncultured Amnibacterium sp. TaxID=1631851 RepID=UPI0035CA2346
MDEMDAPLGGGGRVRLTPAQLRVLEQLATGATSATIASRLFVSTATVRSHIAALHKRFQVHGTMPLVVAAIVVGLLTNDSLPLQLTGLAEFDLHDLEG